MTPDFIGAFVIGLLGAGHCMGMCGGLGALLTLNHQSNPSAPLFFYNFGRIASYMLFGAIVGGLTASLSTVADINHFLVWLRLLAAVLMVGLGLYVGRWWFGVLKLEALGQRLWKHISPAGKALLPLKKSWYALPFGFIWGWLPCGLVYSILTWAAVSGGFLQGALVMGAFGLGTLPAMLLVGFGATKIKELQQSKIFRHIAAMFIIVYGVYTGIGAINMLITLV
ncbi:sulfite exporter TauE/SafE family protein [Vibrio fluvialis]|nr:sulfite exporter TauE/SafE family protein [Vibrio fluvialis]ELO1776596.1 sulfite exporter TauE/SafE family protein [Vibrio fluvialis]